MNNMSRIGLVCRVLTLVTLAFTFPAIAASHDGNTVSVSFKTAEQFLVVVPVSINGVGPFNFMLDTGAPTTLMDWGVADQLSLHRVGEKRTAGIQGDLRVSIVHSQSISMAGDTVRDLNIDVLPKKHFLPSNIRGVLGEDFLGNFDLLIDNKHRVVELQQGSGLLSDMFDGEHLPVKFEGTLNGQCANHRLIVTGSAIELGDKPISLLLDSGVNYLYLFGGEKSLGIDAKEREFVATTLSGSLNQLSMYTKMVREMRFGNKKLSNLIAVAPQRTTGKDTEGLMPTSAFRSIFISHSQKFVILDPSRKPTLCTR